MLLEKRVPFTDHLIPDWLGIFFFFFERFKKKDNVRQDVFVIKQKSHTSLNKFPAKTC